MLLFLKEVIYQKICVLISSTSFSETFLIPRRIDLNMIKNCIGIRVKYPTFSSDFSESNFLGRFSNNILMPNFIEIRPLGAESLHADRWTDGRTDGQT
jgi:hypothetical protein